MDHPLPLEIDVSDDGTRTLLKVVGELDVATAPVLGDACRRAGSPLALDLSGVTFVDGTGIGSLADLAAAHPEMVLVALSPMVERLIDLGGLADRFVVADPG